jgi:MscS family membrane protein
MKLKLDIIFRGFLLMLVVSLAWGTWTTAWSETNQPGLQTNEAPAFVKRIETLQQHFIITFGLDKIDLLRRYQFLGEPLWKYPASLIYLLLAFYVARLIDWIACAWLSKLTAKTATTMDDLLLKVLRGPIKVVAFVVLVHIGLNIFDWSFKVQTYLSRALIIIVAASLTYLALRVLQLLLDLWKRRVAHEDHRFNNQLFSFLSKSLTAFVIVIAVLVTAQNLGINMTAAITSLSIGGLAVGLAAQDTLANLFGAIAVFTDKPFLVGDQVRIDGAEGQVEEVGLRSTRVRNAEGYLLAVPNKTMGNVIITNITRRATIKTVMNFSLSRALPASKIEEAARVLEEIYRNNPMTKDVWVSFNQFTGGNINIVVWHWWKGTDYQQYLIGMHNMNLAVKERFDAEQIQFA